MQENNFFIVGGGMAGLTAAKYIKKFFPKSKVRLFEASNRLGGRCGSYFDKALNCRLDYAVHAILKSNHEARKLWGQNDFCVPSFFDFNSKKIASPFRYFDDIALAALNEPLGLVDKCVIKVMFWKLFPFINAAKVYFSQNTQQQTLVSPQVQYLDDVFYNHRLCEIVPYGNHAQKLVFQNSAVKLRRRDVLILALDNMNASHFLMLPKLKHNSIINLHYLTSQPIFLPNGKSFMGVHGAQFVQWLSVHQNVLSVTISFANSIHLSDDELKREVWKEICLIRNVASAFVPPCRVLRFKRATVALDAENVARRPSSAQTLLDNVFVAGDWTMKNLPSSIETAALSGKRAALQAKKFIKSIS